MAHFRSSFVGFLLIRSKYLLQNPPCLRKNERITNLKNKIATASKPGQIKAQKAVCLCFYTLANNLKSAGQTAANQPQKLYGSLRPAKEALY